MNKSIHFLILGAAVVIAAKTIKGLLSGFGVNF